MDTAFKTATQFLKEKGLLAPTEQGPCTITHPTLGSFDLAKLMEEWATPPTARNLLFDAGNDIDLATALLNYPVFKTIGDRLRFVETLHFEGFAIVRVPNHTPDEYIVRLKPGVLYEVINHDGGSWVRWHKPDFSDNGNIDLPPGQWETSKTTVENKADQITLRRITE